MSGLSFKHSLKEKANLNNCLGLSSHYLNKCHSPRPLLSNYGIQTKYGQNLNFNFKCLAILRSEKQDPQVTGTIVCVPLSSGIQSMGHRWEELLN